MSAYTFNTLTAMRALTDAGMQEPVAEAVVNTMSEAVTEGVATGADIVNLKAELKADIAVLKTRLDTMQWVLGVLTALVLLMASRMFGVL